MRCDQTTDLELSNSSLEGNGRSNQCEERRFESRSAWSLLHTNSGFERSQESEDRRSVWKSVLLRFDDGVGACENHLQGVLSGSKKARTRRNLLASGHFLSRSWSCNANVAAID